MPELPDLEVIREFLAPRLCSAAVASVDIRRPIILRNLAGGDAAGHLLGHRFAAVDRRGKFLMMTLENGVTLVVNPMLAGRIRYGEPPSRTRARDALVIGLSDGRELRYHDAADMGKVYLTHDLNQVPAFAEQGPEATDPSLSLAVFGERLGRHRGEIKGVLTNQTFVAGIGNAYADEILWSARLYPFRKRTSLSDDEIGGLYTATRTILADAIATLRTRVGDAIDVEVRDFLAIHGRPGQSCPRCGGTISEVRRAGTATNFCRTCQPGLMVGR